MAYVYRHIRLDTGQPFYVGIGSDDGGKYTRANTSQCRNRYWHNIVNKVGYEIEIMLDEITWEETIKKEVEFIKLYGRQQFGGLLINLTDGGEGNVGYVTSDESKAKQRLKRLGKKPANAGKPMPLHVLEILRAVNTGKPSWNKGVPLSEERKAQHSKTMTGRESTFKGKSHTEEAKLKNALAHKGKTPWNKGKPILPHVQEALINGRANKPAWNKGKKMTEEWMSNNENGMKGKKSLRERDFRGKFI